MRIAVGFRVTPDYEALRASDWARAAAGDVDTRYVRRVLDTFDESALELALRLRDARAAQGCETGLAAFSVAGRQADPFLKTLQALGFERAARVDSSGGDAATGAGGRGVGAGLDFAPAATARVIAACTRELGGDVLLLGCLSDPGEDGTMPFFVAEELGRPCLTQVTAIEPAGEDGLRVTFAADDGPVRATIRTPCVLAVGNAVVSHLRVPTLTDRLAAREATIAGLQAADLGVDVVAAVGREPAVLTGLAAVDRSRAGAIAAGATAAAKARELYDAHLRARLARL
jgi:electron transfer flavoprotein alpha/beta subunit